MQANKEKDTFTFWGVQSVQTRKILEIRKTRIQARRDAEDWRPAVDVAVVKLECRIALPTDTYPTEFESAWENAGKPEPKSAAFALWKGVER